MRKQQCQHRFNTSTITICNRHVSPRRSTNSRLQIPPYGLHADRLGPVHLLLVKLSQNAHYEEAWSVLRQSVVNCVQHRMQNLNSDAGIDVPTARHPCRDLASRARTVCEPDATLYGRSLGTNPSDARCTHLGSWQAFVHDCSAVAQGSRPGCQSQVARQTQNAYFQHPSVSLVFA